MNFRIPKYHFRKITCGNEGKLEVQINQLFTDKLYIWRLWCSTVNLYSVFFYCYIYKLFVRQLCLFSLTSSTSEIWDKLFSQVCTEFKNGPMKRDADMLCKFIALSSKIWSTSSIEPSMYPRCDVPFVYGTTVNFMPFHVSSISLTPCQRKN